MKWKRLTAAACTAVMLCSVLPIGSLPEAANMIVASAENTEKENGVIETINAKDGFSFDVYGSWEWTTDSSTGKKARTNVVREYAVLMKYTGSAVIVDVPAEFADVPVTVIGKDAFMENYETVVINLPDTITTIEDGAFSCCYKLTKITIPDGLTSIGEQAFWGTALVSVTLPDSVTTVGEYLFCKCESLSTVKLSNNLSVIPQGMFGECSALKRIEIPDNVQKIEKYAFSQCHGLRSIKLPDSLISIGKECFGDCNNLTEIQIPDTVAVIEENTFLSCSSLSDVTLPASLVSIGDYAFSGCSLKTIYFPDGLVSIGESAFSHCNLKEVTLPESVSSIKEYAFSKDTTIYGFKDSFAETYANEYGNKFIYISEYPAAPTPAGTLTPGDVNNDQTVDILDVIAVNKHLLGASTLTEEGKANADVDGKDGITSEDSLLILKYALEIIDIF